MDAIIGIRGLPTAPEKRHGRTPIRAPAAEPSVVVSLQPRPGLGGAPEREERPGPPAGETTEERR